MLLDEWRGDERAPVLPARIQQKWFSLNQPRRRKTKKEAVQGEHSSSVMCDDGFL